MEGLLILVVVLCVYFFPTIVARHYGSRYTGPIFMVNLLFGWMLVGWGVAMVWAMMPVENKKGVKDV